MKIKVSIVIPTKDRENDLKNLIESISLSTYKNYEIIVVNNSTIPIDGKIKHSVQCVIENNKNLGIAEARSQGALISKGKYVMFIDDDNILDRECIEKLIETLENNHIILAAGPLTFYNDNKSLIQFCKVIYNFNSSRFDFIYNINPNELYFNRYAITDNLHNCFMVRRDLGTQIGWFDKNVFLGGTEFEFFLRVKKESKKKLLLVTDTLAKCFHNTPSERNKNELRSLGLTSKERLFYFQRNRGLIIGKYGNIFNKLIFGFIFYPLFLLFYSYIVIKNIRFDYLKSNFQGVYEGYFYLFKYLKKS